MEDLSRVNTKRRQLDILRSQLDNERTSFLQHWRELGDHILPRRPRFTLTDVNRGDRRNQKITDTTAPMAARTLRSGMMSGVTSPARPWFRLTTPDPDLAEFSSVKEWLHIVSQRIATSFLRSNLYNILPITYGDVGVFATGAMSIEEDFNRVMHFNSFPIGSYYIANNETGKVDVFYREFRMTIRQMISMFGRKTLGGQPDWSNFSNNVKSLYDQSQLETWIDICHVIRPNPDYDPTRAHSKFKKYESCYFERGFGGNTSSGSYMRGPDENKYLRESGYDRFPILVPRWEVTGEDSYGTDCPGMVALGDIKQLMLGERRIMQAIEKMVNPPMTAPSALKNQKASILPGDITYLDVREGQQGFRPAHEVNARIVEMENKQGQVRQRIDRAFFVDLFLMLSQSDRRDITAREIDERHEEKLLALGPVLEQLNQDLFDPLIDNAFAIHLAQGLLPPPPEELQGIELKVEYISIMAQAQKMVGLGGLERFSGFVGQIAAVDPSILDKVNGDKMIDVYGDLTSVAPGIVRGDDETQQIRAQRAQQQAAQQKAAMAEQAANAAQKLSQADMSGDNALTRLTEQSRAGQLAPQ